jgi:hypothetical protein
VHEEDRAKHFGQRDHLRTFGEDFPSVIEGKGFVVSVVDECSFSESVQKRNVLFSPAISNHPFAANHRRAFFVKEALDLGQLRSNMQLFRVSTGSFSSPSSRRTPLIG